MEAQELRQLETRELGSINWPQRSLRPVLGGGRFGGEGDGGL